MNRNLLITKKTNENNIVNTETITRTHQLDDHVLQMNQTQDESFQIYTQLMSDLPNADPKQLDKIYSKTYTDKTQYALDKTDINTTPTSNEKNFRKKIYKHRPDQIDNGKNAYVQHEQDTDELNIYDTLNNINTTRTETKQPPLTLDKTITLLSEETTKLKKLDAKTQATFAAFDTT